MSTSIYKHTLYINVHFGIAYKVKYWMIAFYMQYPKGFV